MIIEKTSESKLSKLDLDKVSFGDNFTDHMLICKYKDNKWGEPSITPYRSLEMSPATQVFHYSQTIFEGMKAFKDEEDNIFLFRPNKNLERFNKSAIRMAMPEVSEELFIDGIKELVNLESGWTPKGDGNALYIRPFMFASEGVITARSAKEYTFIVICSVVKSYYTKPLNIKIESNYSRSASGGVGFAKTGGNYAAAFYPTNLAQEEGYDQIIWTDAATHNFVEEAGTMNVFFRIDDTLVTAPTSESILKGVTRSSIITLAKDRGLKLEVRPIKVEEVIDALEKNRLKEAFGCGTAVVLHHFESIGYGDKRYKLPELAIEENIGLKLKQQLIDIQYNKAADPFGWRIGIV